MTTPDTKPTFSFAGLSLNDFEDSELSSDGRRAGTKYVDNPFVAVLKASHSERKTEKDGSWRGKGKGYLVPDAEAAKLAEDLIRNAAETLEVGSRVQYKTEKTGAALTLEYVGGETKPVLDASGQQKVNKDGSLKVRRSGGTMQAQTKDGKVYRGKVRVVFAAAPHRKTTKTEN